MKVSIVIPTFNAEKYLPECVESALNQTYKEKEVIVVDDGSTDNSLEVLRKYEGRITIISKKNGGTASALNTGIKKMSGEWFKWLSADDALYPNALEELISEAKKLKNKKKYILYSNYDIINEKGKKIRQFIEPDYNNFSPFDANVILLDHYVGNGTTSLIHKSALDEFGFFDETIGYGEDYELWLRFCLLYGCRLHLVPKILARYRVHEKQLTQKKVGDALENSEKIRKIILGKLDSKLREKYKISLTQLKKNKPFLIRTRHTARDIMLRVLPKSASHKILKTYLERKNKNDE